MAWSLNWAKPRRLNGRKSILLLGKDYVSCSDGVRMIGVDSQADKRHYRAGPWGGQGYRGLDSRVCACACAFAFSQFHSLGPAGREVPYL